MASTAAVLNILVNANTGKATAELSRFNAQLKATETQSHRTSRATGLAATAIKGVGLAAGVGAVYGLYKGITAGAKFERQMSSLGAVSEATGKQMKALEEQALKLGESTQYTANQVAEAQNELVKGGLTVQQVLGGGLKAALSLAAAGQLELAEAAETTVNSMKLFKLHAKDAEQIADTLATAANKTTADVSDFSMALKQGGSMAKLAGYSFNETVTVLEALAEAGIKNSDAGTSMKTSLIQLLRPSEKQTKLAKELGLHILTNNGELKNAAGLSKELARITDGLTKAERAKIFATLAGTDGVRTLNALYEAGPKKLHALERANARQGTAAEIAGKKMNNLQGDWEQFTGALETAGIKVQRALKKPLRETVKWLTEATQNITNFDYAGALKEVEAFYNKLGDATRVELGGIKYSLFPNPQEMKERGEAILALAKTEVAAIVDAWQWLENASINTFSAVSEAIGWVTNAGEEFGDWISRAVSNVSGFVQALAPFQAVLAIAKTLLYGIGIQVAIAVKAFEVFSPLISMVANNFKSVWVVAVEVASAVLQTFLKFMGNVGSVIGDIVGIVSNLLRGKWGNAWKDAKQLVVDVWHTIIDVIKGAWTVIKTLVSGGIGAVWDILHNYVDKIGEVAGNIAGALLEAFSTVWETIEGVFSDGVDAIAGFLQDIADIINPVLSILGLGTIHIKGGDGKSHGGEKGNGGGYFNGSGKQRGGIMFGGTPSGDSIPALLERGEYVLNRNAVNKIGSKQLDALNFGAAPRFQNGGPVELSIGGGLSSVASSVAEGFAPLVGGAAQTAATYIKKLPTPPDLPGMFGDITGALYSKVKDWLLGLPSSVFSGGGKPGRNKVVRGQLGDNSWVDSHTIAVTQLLDKKFGLTMSSGYRSPAHNAEIGGAPGSLHTHGDPSNPGATDSVGPMSAMQAYIAYAKSHVAGLQEAMVDNYSGTGYNAHLGFFQRGGLMRLQGGGSAGGKGIWAGSPIDKSYPTSDGFSGAKLPGYVIAALAEWAGLPGKTMLQITEGESGGHPGMDISDPPGRSKGLYAINDHYNPQYASSSAMRNPILNTLAAAALAKAAGGPNANIWHGSSHVTGWDQHFTGDISAIAKHIGASGSGSLSAGQEKKAEAAATKRHRESRLDELRKMVGKSKTKLGRKTALWDLIGFMGKFGIFKDKGIKQHVLSEVLKLSALKNPLNGIPGLNRLAAYMEKEVPLSGRSEGNFPDLSDKIKEAREKGGKVSEHRRKKAFRKIEGRGILSKEQAGKLAEFSEAIERLEETIGVKEGWFGTRQSEGGAELSDTEVLALQSLNEGLLGNLTGKRGVDKDTLAQMQRRQGAVTEAIKAAQPKGSKTHWKLPALLGERSKIRETISDLSEDLKDLQGVTGAGGRINDVRLVLANLTGSSAAPSEADSNRVAYLEEQLRFANQRNLVFERQKPIIDSYAGAFASGGFIPTGKWGIAGEAGPEIIHGPANVIPQGGIGNVRVEVYDHTTKVFVNDQEVEAVVQRMQRNQGRGAKTIGSKVAGR